jgi:hypothetical protein
VLDAPTNKPKLWSIFPRDLLCKKTQRPQSARIKFPPEQTKLSQLSQIFSPPSYIINFTSLVSSRFFLVPLDKSKIIPLPTYLLKGPLTQRILRRRNARISKDEEFAEVTQGLTEFLEFTLSKWYL